MKAKMFVLVHGSATSTHKAPGIVGKLTREMATIAPVQFKNINICLTVMLTRTRRPHMI